MIPLHELVWTCVNTQGSFCFSLVQKVKITRSLPQTCCTSFLTLPKPALYPRLSLIWICRLFYIRFLPSVHISALATWPLTLLLLYRSTSLLEKCKRNSSELASDGRWKGQMKERWPQPLKPWKMLYWGDLQAFNPGQSATVCMQICWGMRLTGSKPRRQQGSDWSGRFLAHCLGSLAELCFGGEKEEKTGWKERKKKRK